MSAEDKLKEIIKSSHLLIQWPDVQEYMDEDWFDEEAVLADDSAYFIPALRVVDLDTL